MCKRKRGGGNNLKSTCVGVKRIKIKKKGVSGQVKEMQEIYK